jgi:hypothetical protein
VPLSASVRAIIDGVKLQNAALAAASVDSNIDTVSLSRLFLNAAEAVVATLMALIRMISVALDDDFNFALAGLIMCVAVIARAFYTS